MRRWNTLIICVVVAVISSAQAQALPPGPASIGNMARTYTDADILDMFGPAAPRRQVSWGSVFRFTGMVATGATWVYGALSYFYSTLDEAAAGMYDEHLNAEFGEGTGVVMSRIVRVSGPPQWRCGQRGMGQWFGDSGSGCMPAMRAAVLEMASTHNSWRQHAVIVGWQPIPLEECSGILSGTIEECEILLGYVPLQDRMSTGQGGRPYSTIKDAMDAYVDDHPLSESWPGLYPGMVWDTPAPNVNQWTDRLVNPGLDSDGDGYSDGWEIGAGTDPSDPLSHPEGPPDVRLVPVVPEPGTGGQPVPEPGIGPAPVPEIDPAPGVTPGPAPEPEPGDGPQPVMPGEPEPSPDPEEKPGESEPGTDEEADETTECWPLACEQTLVRLVNAAREGNRLSGDMWEQLSYQSDILLAEHAQLVYQSELALAELAYSEYQVVLLESQLEQDNWRNRALQAQLDEAIHQRSVHLATLAQLEYQSNALVEQLEWQIYLAESQADLVVQAEFQSEMQGRMVTTQESILAELQAEGAALPEFQPVVLPEADLSVLAAWEPDVSAVAVLFDSLADEVATDMAVIQADMQVKFPFAITSAVAAPPTGGFNTDCPQLSLSAIPGNPTVDVCSGAIDQWLSTVGRAGMAALLTFGFIWLTFRMVRNA